MNLRLPIVSPVSAIMSYLEAYIQKKRESQYCCLSHSSKLWHCSNCRDKQRRSPRRYANCTLPIWHVRGITYPWASLLLCWWQLVCGTARFRWVKNKASSNAFLYIATLAPPFRRELSWLYGVPRRIGATCIRGDRARLRCQKRCKTSRIGNKGRELFW